MVRNYKRKTVDRWSKQDLLDALTEIKDSELNINEASRKYGISRATLYRQFQKFLQSGAKNELYQFRSCGGNPILTVVEEGILAKIVMDLREIGHTVTPMDVRRICYEYCLTNGIPNQFSEEKRCASDDWYYGFLKRHPEAAVPKKSDNQKRKTEPDRAGATVKMEEDKSSNHVPAVNLLNILENAQPNDLPNVKRKLAAWAESPVLTANDTNETQHKRPKLMVEEERNEVEAGHESQQLDEPKTELKGIESAATKVVCLLINLGVNNAYQEGEGGAGEEEEYDEEYDEQLDDEEMEEEEDIDEEEEGEEEGEEEELGEEEEELGEEEEVEEEQTDEESD